MSGRHWSFFDRVKRDADCLPIAGAVFPIQIRPAAPFRVRFFTRLAWDSDRRRGATMSRALPPVPPAVVTRSSFPNQPSAAAEPRVFSLIFRDLGATSPFSARPVADVVARAFRPSRFHGLPLRLLLAHRSTRRPRTRAVPQSAACPS